MSFTLRGADGRLYTLSSGARIDAALTPQDGSAAKNLVQAGYKGTDHVAADHQYGPPFQL